MNEKALFQLTYGLYVLTAAKDGRQNGCIINTAGQVTNTPNRIQIAVNKANYTHDMIKETGVFNVSMISQKASFELFKRFGFQSGKDVDKFAGFEGYAVGENGVNYITDGCNGYISVKVEQTLDLGTHTLFIGLVTDMDVLNDVPSTTYGYYQDNIKPKPQAPKGEGKPVWICKVCGYVYEGENLPADYICPLCKHPASDFEKGVR
ncbi:MAG: flavin reductase [Lachnospiraceae bacterium]|nr:flavin reductase [Lachnospiraceae bacterium]MDY5701341.1 flavin reductase [Lachnospiraceae bacterium]